MTMHSVVVALLALWSSARGASASHASVWDPIEGPIVATPPVTESTVEVDAVSLTLPLYNVAGFIYYFKMQVGTPPQTVRVWFDTAASDVAIAAVKSDPHFYYNHSRSTTYKPDGRAVTLRDRMEGVLVYDRLGLLGDVAAGDQPFVEVTNVSAYGPYYASMPYDGWFGLGQNTTQSVGGLPTFVRSLDKLRVLDAPCVSISTPRGQNGAIRFGSRYAAEATAQTVSRARTDPHAGLWGFNVGGIQIGDVAMDLLLNRAARQSPNGFAALDNTQGSLVGPADTVNSLATLLNATALTYGRFSVPCNTSLPDVSFMTTETPPSVAYTLTKDELLGRRVSLTDCELLISSRDPSDTSIVADWSLGIPLFHRYSFGFCWDKIPGSETMTPFLTKALYA